ncbi:MAG: heme-copper oxidase subunit III, partial [Terriglobales bacterium]
MSAAAISISEMQRSWNLPYRGKVAMACLIVAESAIFTIFVVAYLFYLGKSLTGPTPREVL